MHHTLIIRAREQGLKTQQIFESLNIKCDLVSLSEVKYYPQRISDSDLNNASYIIISSQNALTCISEEKLALIKNKFILSVTKSRILDNCRKITYFDSMSLLLEHIKLNHLKGNFLYLRGNFSSLTDDNHKFLDNIHCKSLICYEIHYNNDKFVEILQNLESVKYNSICFFSKNSSDYFMSLIKQHNKLELLLNIKLCCISSRVGESFESLNSQNILIAKSPDLRGLTECLDYQ